jgi:uncharacterized protein
MEEAKIIGAAKEYAADIFKDDCSGHDDDHTLRVFENAQRILKTEPQANAFIVSLAALLHDVDDIKLFPNDFDYQNARKFMVDQAIDSKIQERVVDVISQVSFKANETSTPSALEGKIVQDADRLDAIGAIGIARAFAYGGSHHRKIYDPKEKPKTDMTYEEYRNGTSSTINHFYEKLLLLKDLMNTEEAKRMAIQRQRFMLVFLEEFYAEVSEEQ